MIQTNLKIIHSRYRRLADQLAGLSWIARGNAYRRFLVRKIDGKDKKCGPYYILTRKQNGRTITHALNELQFKLYTKAIAQQKKTDQILKQMRKFTVKYIRLSTPKLPSRKRSKSP